MDYFDYATMHDLVRRAGLTNDPRAAFYREMQAAAYVERARGVEGMAVEYNRCTSEFTWCSAGRPHYKLWPGIFPLLAGVGIDVPVDYASSPAALIQRLQAWSDLYFGKLSNRATQLASQAPVAPRPAPVPTVTVRCPKCGRLAGFVEGRVAPWLPTFCDDSAPIAFRGGWL